ncbi:MAG: hypothetical protein ACO3EE_09100 [Flavobacteriales bacterium]
MKNNNVILHGECMVFPAKTIPKTAKKKITANYVIVAPSETVGNHHVVDVIDGVDFYEDANSTLFMESSVDTTIRCLHANRHDTITLPAGTYEFGTQQEYDPFTARLQAVRD